MVKTGLFDKDKDKTEKLQKNTDTQTDSPAQSASMKSVGLDFFVFFCLFFWLQTITAVYMQLQNLLLLFLDGWRAVSDTVGEVGGGWRGASAIKLVAPKLTSRLFTASQETGDWFKHVQYLNQSRIFVCFFPLLNSFFLLILILTIRHQKTHVSYRIFEKT